MSYPSAMTSLIHNPQLRVLNVLQENADQDLLRTSFLSHSSSGSSDRCRRQRFSGITIDCEHGHVSDDSMHSSTAAIAALGVSPLVCLRMTHSDLVKRALDAGALSVLKCYKRHPCSSNLYCRRSKGLFLVSNFPRKVSVSKVRRSLSSPTASTFLHT
ncbi:uncharacterized protein N7443_006497 [Penicillium atrosanguineum]|uniref:uncharacterized protein n=1 Tax=Penicillium atrosanguineum TaxID=1132637 RepID=UPI00239214F4|nr:uncharacterized protein N7443_006497 [Penicillium atrosanguineum]KAJ5298377.1 hypothetical protein N7443_006497 [Penicillium atrosanguineum]